MMKKLLIMIFCLLIAVTCGSMLVACNQTNADDLTNVRMTSNEPNMEITVLSNGEAFGHTFLNGERIDFYCDFFLNVKFSLTLKDDIRAKTSSDSIIVAGTTKYLLKENKVVISINQDDLLDNKYVTIILVVSNIDPQDDVLPSDRHRVSWIAQGVNMFFTVKEYSYKGGNGLVKIGTDVIKIYFEWNVGQRFSVYLFNDDNTMGETSVMDGTYNGGGETFTINILKDGLLSNLFTTISFTSQLYSPPAYVPPSCSN